MESQDCKSQEIGKSTDLSTMDVNDDNSWLH